MLRTNTDSAVVSFVADTLFQRQKKKTLYCGRVLKNGKTCKEFAPRLKHRILANRNEVLKVFDTQRGKMYKRYERTLNTPDTVEKPLSFEEYYDWLEKSENSKGQLS